MPEICTFLEAEGFKYTIFIWRSVEPFGFERANDLTTNRRYITPSTETITVKIPGAKTAEIANMLHTTTYAPLAVTDSGAQTAAVSIQLTEEPLCIHVTM